MQQPSTLTGPVSTRAEPATTASDIMLCSACQSGRTRFYFSLFLEQNQEQIHRTLLPAGWRGDQEPGTIIFVPVNNKGCACALAKITFTKYAFTSFSMPSRIKEKSCWLDVIQLFQMTGFWALAA